MGAAWARHAMIGNYGSRVQRHVLLCKCLFERSKSAFMFPFITVSNICALHTSHSSRFIDLLRAERAWDRFPETGQELFTFSETLDPPWGPHTLLLDGYCGFFHWVHRPAREAGHSPPCRPEVKNACSFNSSYAVGFCGMQKDSFTFTVVFLKMIEFYFQNYRYRRRNIHDWKQNILFHKDKSTCRYRKQKKTVTEFHNEVENVTVIFSD
jgi:hypothetical protein